MRWVIAAHTSGAPALTYAGGDPQAPWLARGPYLWADGTRARSDGLPGRAAIFNPTARTLPLLDASWSRRCCSISSAAIRRRRSGIADLDRYLHGAGQPFGAQVGLKSPLAIRRIGSTSELIASVMCAKSMKRSSSEGW